MAAYAALVSLMHLIHDLEHHPSPPISLDRQQVESITQHITFFQEFLQAYNPSLVADENDEEANDPLEIRIAGAAYAAEDAIESHIVKSIQQMRNNAGIKITQLFIAPKEPNIANDEKIKSINLCRDSLQRVIEDMNSIKKVVAVKVDSEKKKKALVVHDQVAMTSVLASVTHNETMVGSDDILLEITEKLAGGQLDFQVIPIVGMGGIGKTFLARSIYARPRIREHFDICAWATISQKHNTGEILCEVLSHLLSSVATSKEKIREQLSGKSVDQLGLQLHKYLFCRRFLIVMDDMWSIDAWDKIQCYFPNNDNGSRVLVTTRLSQLSSELNNDYSLHMSFLDEASSWNLFSKTVFGEESCPSELEEIGEKIVENCRGLPLSIVVVGGVLKKMDATRGSWESVRDNFTSVVNMDNDKHCLRLLKMSYNHLPVYLKPCFLYMGVFEEDKEVRLSMLVKLWVSEGFLKPRNSETLETTGRGFLEDLIDRNLILIGKLGSTGSIKSCKIHDLLRDMCLKEGQKEGFYHVTGQCNPPPPQGMNTLRRAVIPGNTSKENARGHLISMLYARSVIFENFDQVPPFSNLGLMLRTIHASNYISGKFVVNFLRFQHVNIRHLALRGIDILSFQHVSLIWNLRTLIVSGPFSIKPLLLVDFWKMPQLKHVEIVAGFLSLPDPPISCDGDSVVIMENLLTVKGVMNFKCCEEVVRRIPNIKKLSLEYYDPEVEQNPIERCLVDNNIKHLSRLESLSFISRNNGYNKLTFPQSLKKLTIWFESGFKWEDGGMLEIIGGSLPLLQKLKLTGGRFGEGEWETVEDQFPSLKYLSLISCYGLKYWTAAEEGSSILPRLEHLSLVYMRDLKSIPCELGSIDTLKSIELRFCKEGAVKCAKEIVVEQLELQGEEISFHVDVIISDNDKHLLSLVGPNFDVKVDP